MIWTYGMVNRKNQRIKSLWDNIRRFFESTNMPSQSQTATIASTSASYETAIGMFFGPQSVGVGIGGNNAQVLLNNNDDFSRKDDCALAA
jgi:hypothetical protein